MSEEPTQRPYDTEAMNERSLLDARLVEAGADWQNSVDTKTGEQLHRVLSPTAEQKDHIEKFKDLEEKHKIHAHEDAIGDARLSLYDATQAEIDRPLQEVIKEQVTLTEFRYEIEKVLEKYEGMFISRIPYETAKPGSESIYKEVHWQ